MQDTPKPQSTETSAAEPPTLLERFKRLQARYRSQSIHTPAEWPMNTLEGRESYRQSVARERFLEDINAMPEIIARAEQRLGSVPVGSAIDMDALLYGEEVQ